MECLLGFTVTQCADDHWCRAFNGQHDGWRWLCQCPVCLADGALEVRIAGTGASARLKWRCTAKPACDPAKVRALIAAGLPCRIAARDPRPDALVRQVGKLICSDLDPAEMRLRIGEAIWPELSAAQVADELGLSRATRYRLKCPPSVSR